MYLTILAKFNEAEPGSTTRASRIWCRYFGFHSFVLLVLGTYAFNSCAAHNAASHLQHLAFLASGAPLLLVGGWCWEKHRS